MSEPTTILAFREASIQGGATVAFEAISRWTGDLMYLNLSTSNWLLYLKTYGGFVDPKRKHWDWCFVKQLLVNGEKMLNESDKARNYLEFTMPFAYVERGQRVHLVIENRDNIAHNLVIKIPIEVTDEAQAKEAKVAAKTVAEAPVVRPDVAHFGGRHGHNHNQ